MPETMLYLKKRQGDPGFRIEAVIFDLDGTLLDTKEIFFAILEEVFQEFRFPMVSRELLVEAAADGKFNWDMVLPEEIRIHKDEILPKVWEVIGRISPPLFRDRSTLIAGAEELLKALSSAGAKIGLVTSTDLKQLDVKLHPFRKSGTDHLLGAIVTSDDVEKRKPAAEPLLECAGRLGVPPGECVYVGDMRVDIKAGKSAGMKTIGVLTGFDSCGILEAENPDMILQTVASLQEKLGLESASS
jgi:HAD superfamily hydrolase (TIGR01509 family)